MHRNRGRQLSKPDYPQDIDIITASLMLRYSHVRRSTWFTLFTHAGNYSSKGHLA